MTLSRNSIFMMMPEFDLLVNSTQIGVVSNALVVRSSSLLFHPLLQNFISIIPKRFACAYTSFAESMLSAMMVNTAMNDFFRMVLFFV